ncbi:hypothetical protein AB0B62_18655 [Micromonospora chalcea]|uniref:hypothetical protein n=1 Tax=Micromonospora chalcea TaxID=1874 RepID=UPI0033EA292A
MIFHSDRDSEWCSADFARVCARWKVRQSMGRVGSCFDNAVGDAGELAVAEGVPGVWRVDRRRGTFTVHAVQEDVPFTLQVSRAVHGELRDLASWLSLTP